MGDIAEDILNGDFDEETGEYLGEGQGFPRSFAREQRNLKNKNETPSSLGAIQKILIENGYTITAMKKIDYGVYMKTASGAVINVYTSGKVALQGKPDEKLKSLIK